MAGTSAKRIFRRNRIIIWNLLIGEIVFFILFLLFSTTKPKRKFVIFLKLIPELLGVYFIIRVSKPRYVTINEVRRLRSAGVPLDNKGLVSLCFDFIYLSWVIKIVSIFHRWAYFLYFTLLFSFVYEFIPSMINFVRRK